MYIPNSSKKRTAGSLCIIENGDIKNATQVMLDLLLSADPNADIVLVRRFCVAFSSVNGTASSLNPLFLRLASAG